MMAMFSEATSFTSDLSKWDVSKVTVMRYMFFRATIFTSDLSKWADKISNVNDMSGMFEDSGVVDTPGWYPF